ncbi:patatin-domain-containing protein [Rhizopus microsporus ATCC 52813]|uniref:Patatin-domain-containing protein n=2 Tax=Rhizopus microsporus TaxID=58291 RepID=A0A2G4SLK9_RHIZD|nr:patatin-domain-containing protein [Rhizopus microsporus ATCC 52813]PHZ09651.1 patatin-domain-containing protein [Rhizopus microsporus ATCC 52813]
MLKAANQVLQDPLKYIVVPILFFLYNLLLLTYGSLFEPWMQKWHKYKENKPENRMINQLKNAKTFEEWQERAKELDKYLKNDQWINKPESKIYDYKLIKSRLEHQRKAREIGDVDNMMYLLRVGLLRNFGGICDRRLFSHAYVGTKQLIQDYMEEVVRQIEYIESTPDFEPQAKLKFFSDTRQSFGCSALVLQGGTALALYHIGIVKALNEQGLLPRIISGTAIGAMIAALICIHTDEELPTILQPDGINLTAFSNKRATGHFKRRITRFLKYGYLMDMKVLQECVRANVGDLTFEEAYARSKRVLNISVSSSRTQEVPQLLNYLTAPNVLIWSAACCSTASAGLFGSCDLMAKDKNGNIVKWISSNVKWNHWSETSPAESETPLYRLSELFNVNHFIVSQASIYAIPFIAKAQNLHHETLIHKLAYIVASEFKHRLYQLDQLHLLPRAFRGVIEEKMSGNVNVVPDLNFSDLNILFSNPSHQSLAYWILHGERSIWPLIAFIKTRCMIELALDRAVLRLKAMNVEREPVVVRSRYIENKKRAKSMH